MVELPFTLVAAYLVKYTAIVEIGLFSLEGCSILFFTKKIKRVFYQHKITKKMSHLFFIMQA
jgi:hypothetical protein